MKKVAIAKWRVEDKNAIVIQSKGKYMSTMGFSEDGQRLFPEEIVFLSDREDLQVLVTNDNNEDIILSKMEVFGLLDTCNIDMQSYTVYASLREQRFHVFRHGYWKAERSTHKFLPNPQVICLHTQQYHKRAKTVENTTTDETEEEEDGPLPISFDCYRPQSGFSKNNAGKPDFSLILLDSSSFLPSINSLQKTLLSVDKSVSLRLGIVGDSSISFIEFNEFDQVGSVNI